MHSSNRYKSTSVLVISLVILSVIPQNIIHANEDDTRKTVQEGIYFKSDQGLTWGVLMDQRMSNLHYAGPGGVINFGRRAHRRYYVAEWSFARIQYNNSRPVHGSTVVDNMGAGLRYLHLRKLYTPPDYNINAGVQANVFANLRIAPRLGNSYLFADLIAELRPQADLEFGSRFLWREWNVELSVAASLLGYTLRIPEYGVSLELDKDGGIKIQGYEKIFLMPHNYAHVTTGIFFRESFRGESNPNWLRIGYAWDYYTMAGRHNLNMNNALHQLVFEFYFRLR